MLHTLTDFNNFCSAVTRNEFVTKFSHLLAYYFNSIVLMASSKRAYTCMVRHFGTFVHFWFIWFKHYRNQSRFAKVLAKSVGLLPCFLSTTCLCPAARSVTQ